MATVYSSLYPACTLGTPRKEPFPCLCRAELSELIELSQLSSSRGLTCLSFDRVRSCSEEQTRDMTRYMKGTYVLRGCGALLTRAMQDSWPPSFKFNELNVP